MFIFALAKKIKRRLTKHKKPLQEETSPEENPERETEDERLTRMVNQLFSKSFWVNAIHADVTEEELDGTKNKVVDKTDTQ